MERVISLLQEKHQYLEQFLNLNGSEMANFANHQFDNLESFYLSRDQILESIQNIDAMIEKVQSENQVSSPNTEMRREFHVLMSAKDQLVKEILAQDLQILSYIEVAKSKIIRELQAVHHNRKGIRAYKSPNVIARLDEEL